MEHVNLGNAKMDTKKGMSIGTASEQDTYTKPLYNSRNKNLTKAKNEMLRAARQGWCNSDRTLNNEGHFDAVTLQKVSYRDSGSDPSPLLCLHVSIAATGPFPFHSPPRFFYQLLQK